MIRFFCSCGKQLQTKDELAGKAVACPACGSRLTVPTEAAPEPVRDPAPEAPPERPVPRRRARDQEDEVPAGTSGKAITSLVLGLLSFVCICLTGIPALIFGFLALGDIGRSRGRLGGKGMAITGLILGGLGSLIIAPILILIALLLPAVQKVRLAANQVQSSNNLKQIGLALHTYHDVNRRLPPAAKRGPDGRPLLSWRVAILPYLEQQALYQQFKQDEPWDGPNNKKLVDSMPLTYAMVVKPAPPGQTFYQALVGPGTAWELDEGARIPGDFADGTSMTILVAEAANPVPWSKPEDITFNPNGGRPALGTTFKGSYQFLMGDGSVRFVSQSITVTSLKAAITRNGNDVVGPDF